MWAVIMAGGKGTRIRSVRADVPKPMIPIVGKPILEYQIEVLKREGIKKFILITGYLGEIIEKYFGKGEKWGVEIIYIKEEEPLGTCGSFYYLKEFINSDFLVCNGDIIFDISLSKFYKFHKEKKALVTLLTHPNTHPFDSGILITDENGKVIRWLHKEDKRTWYPNMVNAGIHLFTKEILEEFTKIEKRDMDRELLDPLIKSGKIFGYKSPEYICDMGIPERYKKVQKDLQTGEVNKRNLEKKQKAIFLDRDGTINKYVGFLNNIEELELLPLVAEAIKKINESGFLAIVITNQPVIARGEITEYELKEIHNKLETLLGKKGAYLDDILYCPHHPDKGYEGEREDLKIQCKCRKPNPGMIYEAAKKYNIDLKKSWMIGDSIIDGQTGKNAGCKIKILQNSVDRKQRYDFENLYECVTAILKMEKEYNEHR